MGFEKGNKFGKGRPAGSPNKSTQEIRDAYKKLLEDNLDNMSLWLAQIAADDPNKAVDMMLKLSEYILPKLARQEIVGNDGQDLFKDIKFTFTTPDTQEDGEK
jgi:DNA-binding MurR/RpiR family transcriptional regulator